MIINVPAVAKLASLSLTPEEEAIYSTQLENILDSMKVLAEVDTADVSPMHNITGQFAKERKDIVKTDGIHGNPQSIIALSPYYNGQSLELPPVFE